MGYSRCGLHVVSALLAVSITAPMRAQAPAPTYELVVLAGTPSATGGFADAQINAAGAVVFTYWSYSSGTSVWAGDAMGVRAIVTSGVPTPSIDEMLTDVGSGHVAINDAGTIAFVGVQETGAQALYVSTRQGWRKALESQDAWFNDPSLNNAGDVTINMSRQGEEGLYLLRRDTLTPIVVLPGSGGPHNFEGLANENELNARGQVVYRAGPPSSIMLVDRGQHELLAIDEGQFSLNNAGDVAVAGPSGVTIVSTARGTTQTITLTPAFSVSLAESGDVVYSDGTTLWFAREEHGSARPAVSTAIVRVGDPVNGVHIAAIDLYRRSLNSRGEIVLAAALSDGRNAVVLARPKRR